MTKKSKYISYEEAVKETARVKGVTEEQADAMLREALQKGELTGYRIVFAPPPRKQ